MYEQMTTNLTINQSHQMHELVLKGIHVLLVNTIFEKTKS